jgi:hypothetical protein
MTQQKNAVTPLGLCLEDFSYAYQVNYITLKIQRQVLKMAFMDVQPEWARSLCWGIRWVEWLLHDSR